MTENRFKEIMIDLSLMTVSPRYLGTAGNKIQPVYYDQLPYPYVTKYDTEDPYYIENILRTIKSSQEIVRTGVSLGTLNGTGCTVTSNYDSGVYSFEIIIDAGNTTGIATINSGTALEYNNWYIQEFYAKTENVETIVSSDTGNLAIDISGGVRVNDRNGIPDGNHPSIISQYFIDDPTWLANQTMFLTFKNVKPGEKILISNFTLNKVTYQP